MNHKIEKTIESDHTKSGVIQKANEFIVSVYNYYRYTHNRFNEIRREWKHDDVYYIAIDIVFTPNELTAE